MPPKIQFTKEEIITAALDIASLEGVSKLSVRKVATKLGCSVAPIYVNFENAEALNNAVLERIFQMVWQYLTKPYTSMGFLNIGIGQIMLAKDYPKVFIDFMTCAPNKVDHKLNDNQEMLKIMSEDDLLSDFTDTERAKLLNKMAIFTHGISSSIAFGHYNNDIDVNYWVDLLEETGMQLIFAAKKDFQIPKFEKHLDI